MKLLACDRCRDIVPLTFTYRTCKCGALGGRYCPNDDDIEVTVRDESAGRVIGLPNEVRYGREQSLPCYIIPWSAPKITRLAEPPTDAGSPSSGVIVAGCER